MSPSDFSLCTSTLIPDLFSIEAHQFDAVLQATADAGFSGISLWTLHHLLLDQSENGADWVKGRVVELGMDVNCIEAISGWANAADASAAVADAEWSLEICAMYEAPLLVAVAMEPQLVDFDQSVKNLAAVADRAASYGVQVCIEYLPWSAIPDISTCWELLRRSERENVGVTFDSWHWHRQAGGPTGRNAEILASIPPSMFPLWQVCDAQAEALDDPMAECLALRPLPGDGVIDNAAVLAIFEEIGAEPLICPEVFNAALLAAGPTSTARRIAEATAVMMAGT